MTCLEDILKVNNLTISYRTLRGKVKAVENVSFNLGKGKILAVVGETGSGKTTIGLAILRILPPNAVIEKGEIWFNGKNILDLDEDAMRRIRGKEISIIFQEPKITLNPVLKIGEQIAEVPIEHLGLDKKEAYRLARKMLERTGVPDPDRVMKSYPHELSGGMAQRVVISIAMILRPKLLVADEPTSALDVSVQAQVLDLIQELVRETGTSVIFITHDLSLAAEIADEILVMYYGKVVEYGDVFEIFKTPKHPYTKALLNAIPRIGFRGKLKSLEEMINE
uniref:ABC transporter ATP-binding protein n=1 Tax=Fervidicoccus fontis TaxID=683846 RepID=A0A7C1E8M4_9CREN